MTALALSLSFPLLAGATDPQACVVANTNPGIGGRSEIVVSDVTPDALALAGFATASGATGEGWTLHLFTPGGANSVLFITLGNGRPSPGTYRITDYVGTDAKPPRGQFVATAAVEGQILGSGFGSVTGELTVIESSPTAVAGCFEFSGRSVTGGSSARLSGTFAAKNQEP